MIARFSAGSLDHFTITNDGSTATRNDKEKNWSRFVCLSPILSEGKRLDGQQSCFPRANDYTSDTRIERRCARNSRGNVSHRQTSGMAIPTWHCSRGRRLVGSWREPRRLRVLLERIVPRPPLVSQHLEDAVRHRRRGNDLSRPRRRHDRHPHTEERHNVLVHECRRIATTGDRTRRVSICVCCALPARRCDARRDEMKKHISDN